MRGEPLLQIQERWSIDDLTNAHAFIDGIEDGMIRARREDEARQGRR